VPPAEAEAPPELVPAVCGKRIEDRRLLQVAQLELPVAEHPEDLGIAAVTGCRPGVDLDRALRVCIGLMTRTTWCGGMA